MSSSRAPVQARGGGFGLDAELARKAAERYDYGMENEARQWIEAISGMEIGDDFGAGLKDGVILCSVANKIHPGIVRRVETKSKMPFKQMENVSAFLKACRVMGVNEFDLFETVDLFELKDLGNVVRCIFALGRSVQRSYPDFSGPTLGVKESSKNQRTFTPDQLADARNAPALQSLGSFRTMKRQSTFHTNNVMLGADAAQSAYRAPPPPPPPSAEKIEQLSRFRSANKFSAFEPHQPEGELSPTGADTPSKEEVAVTVAELAGAADSVTEKDTTTAPVASLVPGLNSSSINVGPTPEEEAQVWIEEVLSEKFLASFGDSLKDGVILCTLMNKIKPGLIPRIQNSPMPFKQMENVSSFLRACRSLGVAEFDLFETVDLFELKNIGQVVQCIHALGRTLQKNVPEYDGPRLGVKESTVNRRQFSEAQLREAATAVPVLAHGSQSVMERRAFDRSASVTFGYDAAISGSNKTKSSPKPTPKKVEQEVAPEPEPKTVEAESTPKPEPKKIEPNESTAQGPSWLVNRMASLKPVSSGTVPKPPLPTGSSSSVLPTRTVWS